MTSCAVYLYCIVRSSAPPAGGRVPAGLPGAGRPEVHALTEGLWLVTAAVPLARYGPEALQPALQDLDWVTRVALAHERVVEHFARSRRNAVVPMKLFTMFSSLERALAETRRRRQRLSRVFDLVDGCEEWGVRVVPGARRTPRRPGASTGTAFLAERKRARDRTAAEAREALDAAERAFLSLSELARDRRRRTEAAGGPRPLLDAAFLVPLAGRARFRLEARRVASEVAKNGAVMTLTGPWPPYNFVRAERGA